MAGLCSALTSLSLVRFDHKLFAAVGRVRFCFGNLSKDHLSLGSLVISFCRLVGFLCLLISGNLSTSIYLDVFVSSIILVAVHFICTSLHPICQPSRSSYTPTIFLIRRGFLTSLHCPCVCQCLPPRTEDRHPSPGLRTSSYRWWTSLYPSSLFAIAGVNGPDNAAPFTRTWRPELSFRHSPWAKLRTPSLWKTCVWPLFLGVHTERPATQLKNNVTINFFNERFLSGSTCPLL